MTLKELKTTYNVLSELGYPVPEELMVQLAQMIRRTETRNRERRKERMTEEQLIRLEAKNNHSIRIYMPDGRLIRKKTNEATFREAIRAIGPERIAGMGLRIGRKDVVVHDPTLRRKRMRKYYFLQPGYFLIGETNSAEQHRILCRIDELLQLDWEIEVV